MLEPGGWCSDLTVSQTDQTPVRRHSKRGKTPTGCSPTSLVFQPCLLKFNQTKPQIATGIITMWAYQRWSETPLDALNISNRRHIYRWQEGLWSLWMELWTSSYDFMNRNFSQKQRKPRSVFVNGTLSQLYWEPECMASSMVPSVKNNENKNLTLCQGYLL